MKHINPADHSVGCFEWDRRHRTGAQITGQVTVTFVASVLFRVLFIGN